MATLGPNRFCRLDEYNKHIPDRIINPEELKAGELFILMLRLGDTAHRAARMPTRINDHETEKGLTVVRFAFLDAELQDQHTTTASVANGYVEDIYKTVVVAVEKPDAHIKIEQGYFRDFFDEMYEQMLVEGESLRVSPS